MGPADSRPKPPGGYAFPPGVGRAARFAGPPRSRAGLSGRAAPNHPGESARCSCPLLPWRWQASPPLAGWPALSKRNEAEAGSLDCGSPFRLTRLRDPGYPEARSLGYMSSGQFTWQTPFSLLDLLSFAWRTKAAKKTEEDNIDGGRQ